MPPRRHRKKKQEMWVVEKIVNDRKQGGTIEYDVKWEGFPDSENTWVPQCDMHCPELLEEYLEQKKQKEAQKQKELEALKEVPKQKKAPKEIPRVKTPKPTYEKEAPKQIELGVPKQKAPRPAYVQQKGVPKEAPKPRYLQKKMTPKQRVLRSASKSYVQKKELAKVARKRAGSEDPRIEKPKKAKEAVDTKEICIEEPEPHILGFCQLLDGSRGVVLKYEHGMATVLPFTIVKTKYPMKIIDFCDKKEGFAQ